MKTKKRIELLLSKAKKKFKIRGKIKVVIRKNEKMVGGEYIGMGMIMTNNSKTLVIYERNLIEHFNVDSFDKIFNYEINKHLGHELIHYVIDLQERKEQTDNKENMKILKLIDRLIDYK